MSVKTSSRRLYARVSTQDRQTLPMQNRAMREYAARRNWTVAMQVLGCIHRTGKPVTMKR
jgi:DNA invertase Pin-like site-specific DNA recombinase